MFDPELKYCLKCNDEYMAHIENCAGCGETLIAGRDVLAREEKQQQRLADRGAEITEDDAVVGIRQGPMADMKRMEALLNRKNIPTLFTGDESSCGKGCGCATNFILHVRQDDVQDAQQVLADEFRKTTALDQHDISNIDSVFDPSAVEVVCPACGHNFPPSTGACPDCGLHF